MWLVAGTLVRLAMDQLLWAPFFLTTIVAAQFTLEVGQCHAASLPVPQSLRHYQQTLCHQHGFCE